MENLEMVSFQIISNVGMAKSCYIEAISLAKQGEIILAKEKIVEGEEVFINAHHAHAELITMEASGNPISVNLLLMHAEDQLMSAETVKIFANEFIDLYETLGGK